MFIPHIEDKVEDATDSETVQMIVRIARFSNSRSKYVDDEMTPGRRSAVRFWRNTDSPPNGTRKTRAVLYSDDEGKDNSSRLRTIVPVGVDKYQEILIVKCVRWLKSRR